MFHDSLSEGQVYWGRVAAVLVVVTAFAYVLSHL